MPAVQPDEKTFQQQVTEYAQLQGWLTYHTFDSRRSAAGFPDLILISQPDPELQLWSSRDRRLLAVELKTETGTVKPEQQEWLDLLAHAAAPEPHVWRPSDWDTIQQRLRRPARSR